MTHRERIERILCGERPDRPAISLWRHFYHRESTTDGLVDALADFQREYDWDFVKINPRASYHVEDWGNRLLWSEKEYEKHTKVAYAVNEPEDWERIEAHEVSEAPVLAGHRDAVWKLRKLLGADTPIFMTVFTPLSIAAYLVGDDHKFRQHLEQNNALVMGAVEKITQTFESFVAELQEAGADGIFLATTAWGMKENVSAAEYTHWGKPFDLRLLEATRNEGFNIWHVCGGDNLLHELFDYPAQMLSWDESHPANLSLRDAFELPGGKTMVGGIDHLGWLMTAEAAEVSFKVREIAAQFRGKPLILGPGCAIAPETPAANLTALRRAVESIARR